MLNISKNSVAKHIPIEKYSALKNVEGKQSGRVLRRIIYITVFLFFIILFLPWTQNIRSNGNVTTLRPDQRPQKINTVIGGRIENWFVQEGDFVKKGDTLLQLSEIKDNYFDPQLLDRTQNQVDLKKESIKAYEDKINIQEEQLEVLKTQRDLKLRQIEIKLQQTKLKTQNDSASYMAAEANLGIANYQYNRADSLYKKGLISLTDWEKRSLKRQESGAYSIEAKNKWLNSQNELINLELERSNIRAKFDADYNKVMSDRFSTVSLKLDTETNVNKLENQYSNYSYRNGLYFITAPQDGYVTRTLSTGLGETIKDGQEVLTLMPVNYNLAAEIYIDPIDLPLVKLNEKVRLQFDGWPAIVFSGWPNASKGTYGGVIYAVDQYISENGKYRILIAPDPTDEPWPEALRFGSGTSAMILLNDVPIWYELWRNVNGFPPDYYTGQRGKEKTKKK